MNVSKKLNLTTKQLVGHLLLLIFILVFVGAFEHFFSEESIYIASFAVTAVLMFSSFSLNLPRTLCCWLFPILFPLAVLLPNLVNQCHNVILGSIIIALSVIFYLFFLGPSLQMQSYVPFLFLYALNINSPISRLPLMLFASFIGGIVVSIVYYISHRKDDCHYNLKEELIGGFKKHFSFVLKILIGMVIAYVIGFYLNDLKTSWIVITVVSVTELDFQNTTTKLWQRITATVIGIIVYSAFLMYVASYYPKIIPILLILISYVYTFLNNYFLKMIFVTFNSLNAAVATMHFPTVEMIAYRMGFILIGAFIALIIAIIFQHLYKKTNSNERHDADDNMGIYPKNTSK